EGEGAGLPRPDAALDGRREPVRGEPAVVHTEVREHEGVAVQAEVRLLPRDALLPRRGPGVLELHGERRRRTRSEGRPGTFALERRVERRRRRRDGRTARATRRREVPLV